MPDIDFSQVVSTNYHPRPLQKVLHENLRRFNVICCHRRFGKTIFSVNHMIDRALSNPNKMPRFAYLAPNYQMAKRVVWDVLKEYSLRVPGTQVNEADLRVDFPNGARIMLLSAETPDSLRGIYLDGVVLDEYALMASSTWSEVIRPTLSDRRGWAIFISTPKGTNSFYDLYEYARSGQDPDWYSALYRASETNLISKEELESNRRTMTEDEYEQEYEASFTAALSGAYFGKELERAQKDGRITTVPYDPAIPVDTAWDLGISDVTAVWFYQSVRGHHRFINYKEWSGLGLHDIVRELKGMPYVLDRIVLPHDAAARDLSSGKTRVQVLYNLGLRRTRVIPRVGSKQESISAARLMFSKCSFDEKGCALGLKLLAQYQKRWNPKNNVYENTPLHNHASNAADAFQQFALGCREDSREDGLAQFKRDRQGGLVAEMEYNPYA